MKNKGCFVVVFFILCMLFGCGKESSQSEETSETVSVIEGTYIVRAKDREKEVLENTGNVTDTEELTVDNSENEAEKPNENPADTTISDKHDSENDNPVQQEETSQPGTAVTPSQPATTTQPSAPMKPTAPSEQSHTHSYSSSVTTNPTCTKNGVKTFSCSCGDTYTETLSATGHHYEGEETTEARCTTTGVMTYTCSCGASYTEVIPATGHDFCSDNQADNIVAPTCTQNGSAEYWCWGWQCEYRETRVLPATGHDMVPTYQVLTEATCTTAGLVKTQQCWNSGCNECVTEVIPATGHSYFQGHCFYCGMDMDE